MSIDQAPVRAGRREWAGLLALSLATLMITFDMFVLLLALPELTADLRPSTVQQLWILDVYGFMTGGFLITMGTLGDRIGRRRLLMIGAACFAVASALCAIATSPGMLIGARALLGIAGATLAPSTLALITTMFRDPRQLGTAIGIWAGGFTLGSILGPVVGGVMLASFWWGSVFLIGIPVMVLLLVLLPMLVPEYRNLDAGRLDPVSAVLSVLAVIAVIYGLKEVARHGWNNPVPLLIGLAGILLAVLFVRRQRHRPDPLMDLKLFGNRSFSSMLIGLVLYALIGASSMYFITQFLQSVAGLSPFRAALCLLPGMVVATIAATVTPLLGQRIRPAYLIAGGLLGVAAAFVLFARLEPGSSPVILVAGFAVMGLCEAPLLTLGTNLVVASAPPEQAGQSSSMTQVANEAGASLGVALMGSLGAAVYVGKLDETAPAGVPEVAREGVAGALGVVPSLPADVGERLTVAAKAAFTDSLNVFATTSIAILLVAAVLIAVLLRQVPPTGKEDHA